VGAIDGAAFAAPPGTVLSFDLRRRAMHIARAHRPSRATSRARTPRARAHAANARDERSMGRRGVVTQRRARPTTRRKTRGASSGASDGIDARVSGARRAIERPRAT